MSSCQPIKWIASSQLQSPQFLFPGSELSAQVRNPATGRARTTELPNQMARRFTCQHCTVVQQRVLLICTMKGLFLWQGICLLFSIGVAHAAVGDLLKTASFTYDNSVTSNNPLKGFVPYVSSGTSTLPYKMEYKYVPMSELMPSKGSFKWDYIEKLLNTTKSHNTQYIPRIYIHYPDASADDGPEFAVPSWMTTVLKRSDGSPDYENTELRQGMKDLIAAYGAKYDGDNRIAFIQGGLLGMWGEWHNDQTESNFASKVCACVSVLCVVISVLVSSVFLFHWCLL